MRSRSFWKCPATCDTQRQRSDWRLEERIVPAEQVVVQNLEVLLSGLVERAFATVEDRKRTSNGDLDGMTV